MGYASYTIYRNGQEIEAGYAVEDVCNKDDCPAKIDRGLDYLCGATPGGDEYGCGGYFCGEHMYSSLRDGEPQCCTACRARALKQMREEFRDELAEALLLSSNGARVTAGTTDAGADILVEFEDAETSCDQLAALIQAMEDVKSAGAVVDRPEVFVDCDNGDQFVVGVA